MGYSTAGEVVKVGEAVTELRPGDLVACVAPHAEYTLGELDAPVRQRVTPLAPGVSCEAGTFHSLATSSVAWAATEEITPDDVLVVLGLGLVGNLVLQCARRYQPALLVGVDPLELRCRVAQRVGATKLINASQQDPVSAVRELTGGQGATIVVDCVGGKAGLTSFVQAQEMLAPGGLLHLIGLYHGAPLPLDASKIMRKRLVGGYLPATDVRAAAQEAMRLIGTGDIQTAPLITHRFSGSQAKEAFDLLYTHPEQAMAVILKWDEQV